MMHLVAVGQSQDSGPGGVMHLAAVGQSRDSGPGMMHLAAVGQSRDSGPGGVHLCTAGGHSRYGRLLIVMWCMYNALNMATL